VPITKHGAKLVKKVEKEVLLCAKDIKKATISYHSWQKRVWIEDYLLNSHSKKTERSLPITIIAIGRLFAVGWLLANFSLYAT